MNDLKRSFGRCVLNSGFLDDFYSLFIDSSPKIKERFSNTDMAIQKRLLKDGISFVIMNGGDSKMAETKLDNLKKSHSREQMNIPSWMYENWKESLLKAVRKNDAQLSNDTLKKWEEVIDLGIERIAS